MKHFRWFLFIVIILNADKRCLSQSSPNSELKSLYQNMQDWMKDSAKVKARLNSYVVTPLDEIFDWQEITRRALPENWVNLTGTWKKRYTQAVRKRIMKKAAAAFPTVHSFIMERNIRWDTESINNDKAKTSFDIIHNEDIKKINVRLIFSGDTWKAYDIRTETFRLIRDFLSGYDALITNGFSHEYVEAAILDADMFFIDDFNANESGDYPKLWGWRKKDDDQMRASQKLYFIQKENENAYLSAHATNASVALVKPFSYNIKEYPYLSWRWRVKEFPIASGNHPSESQAAEVVVIFYQNWLGVPITLHYIWDRFASSCTTIHQQGLFFDTYAKVIRTESNPSDEWYTENVNPFEDYRRIFGEDPPEQIIGMYLLTESNDPLLSSKADYDDFTVKKATPQTSCAK